MGERATASVGLTLALGAPAAVVALLRTRSAPSGPAEVAVPMLAITLALLAYIRWVERKPLGSIGVRRLSASDIAYALGGFVLGFGCIVGLDRAFEAIGLHAAGSTVTSHPLSLGAGILVLSVMPVAEEVIFRGYAIERLYWMSGRVSVAASLSLVVFLALHVPFWGLVGAIEFAPWTILITALYIWRRNLPVCILMHFLGDAMGLVVIPRLG